MSVASRVTVGGTSSHKLLSTPEAIRGAEILNATLQEVQRSGWISIKGVTDSAIIPLALSGEGFKKYGARFFKVVKQDIFLDRVQKAILRATSELELPLKDPLYVYLATSKLGIWKCGEITNTIGVKASAAKLPDVVAFYLKQSNGPNYHNFILFGKGVEKELQTYLPFYRKFNNLVEFLEMFKSGIILDGTALTKPLAARDVRQCEEFLSHIKGLSIDKIESQTLFARFVPDMDQYLAQAEKLRKRIIEILPTMPKRNEIPDLHEASICAEVLENRIPGTKWSKNAKEKKIWFQGTEEQVKEIAEFLKAHCIKASEPSLAKSGKWVVILTNPNFDQIDCLPSFEQWKNKKKAEEKKSSDESSSEKESVPAKCAQELEKCIPGTKWKKNTAGLKVWFEGTEEKAKEIAKYLKAHCIKAKASPFQEGDKWAVMLTNPDFELIEKLPSFELWKIRNL
jgi:hypothetical protein